MPLTKLLLGGVLVLAGATVVAADEPAPAPAPAAEPTSKHEDDGRRTMSRLPSNLGRGAIGVFNRDNLMPFVVGGAAASVSSLFDDDVRESVTEQFGWGQAFETGGGPVYSSIFVVGMFAGGRLAHGARFRAMTYDMLDASVINVAYTELLKVTVQRERPNGQDNKSFPSGHTSNAFALAAVAQRHYGWKLGVPAYAVAAVVGASRLEQDKHWLSDVVAGATLGYIVGRTVVRVNGKPIDPPAGKTAAVWKISPIVSRGRRGIEVFGSF